MVTKRAENWVFAMKKLVPRDKMSKRTRRALDERRRRQWGIPPLTRKIESGKRYQRKQKADEE